MRRRIVEEACANITDTINRLDIPDISRRDVWDALDEELKKAIIVNGEKNVTKEWPLILITDYMEFGRCGNRVHFENKNFERRNMLNSFIMAECVENEGRFIDKILEGLYLILEETSWCLPAHNSYERDEKQYPLPDATRPIIDLFNAESGAEVAIAEKILRPVLEQVCPFISVYVDSELEKRIFKPYEEHHFWWMGDGKQKMLNWTVWCTQNVLLAALSRKKENLADDRLANIIKKAAVSTDYFLDEYGDDGCCDEGAQYFGHAGLCMFNCIDLLTVANGNRSKAIFEEKVIKNIGAYIVKMYVGNGLYINYADCSPIAGSRGSREFLYGLKTDQPVLAGFAAKSYRESDWDTRLLNDEINLYYHVQQALTHGQMMEYPEVKEMPEDSFFESTGIMIARDDKVTFAAKAGDNGDSHNHNDVGSIILYKNSVPVLIDLGVGTYTSKTFSSERYDIWTMQSQYHNLPTFFEKSKIVSALDRAKDKDNTFKHMQHDGEKYAAKNVKCEMNAEKASLSMDIAGAYEIDNLISYSRTATLYKNSCVEVKDHINGEISCVVSLMTYEKPEIRKYGGNFADINIGEDVSMHVEGICNMEIEECPIEDERLGIMWKHSCYRILLEVEDKDFSMKVY
jgi:hypothetical protein